MNKIKYYTAAALLHFSAIFIYSPQALATAPEVLVNKLSDNAYMLRFSDSWTNVGLFKTSQGVVLIDPAAGKENLQKLGQFITDTFQQSACYILNTHDHPDHTSGNDYFQSKGCVFIDNVDILEDLQGLSFNAHTLKDSVFYHKASNSIFVGDIYETRGRGLPTFWSGGLAGLNSAVEWILALADNKTVVIPGHGTAASQQELKSFRKNSVDWVAKVKELNGNGISAREMSNDEQIRKIIERFNVNGEQPFITESLLIRYIEKTLATLEEET